MPTFRISMATSMGIVAVVAIGLAGMLSASSLWTAAAATVTLALLLSAVVAARLLTGIDRAFWAGFALFGGAYLVLGNSYWLGGQFGHDLTAGLSNIAEATVPSLPLPAPLPGQQMSPITPAPAIVNSPAPLPVSLPRVSAQQYQELARARQSKVFNFVEIGRMFLSLLFGLLGGWIARAIAERRESAAMTPGTSSSGSPGRGAG